MLRYVKTVSYHYEKWNHKQCNNGRIHLKVFVVVLFNYIFPHRRICFYLQCNAMNQTMRTQPPWAY